MKRREGGPLTKQRAEGKQGPSGVSRTTEVFNPVVTCSPRPENKACTDALTCFTYWLMHAGARIHTHTCTEKYEWKNNDVHFLVFSDTCVSTHRPYKVEIWLTSINKLVTCNVTSYPKSLTCSAPTSPCAFGMWPKQSQRTSSIIHLELKHTVAIDWKH